MFHSSGSPTDVTLPDAGVALNAVLEGDRIPRSDFVRKEQCALAVTFQPSVAIKA